MSDATSSPPSAAPADTAHLDRLAQLHRMSRTAGLGSTDYAAVNTCAVLGIIIGVASALSLITPVFLFVPLVGLVVSIAGLKQVRQSNGTQTGFALALLGLLLSLGFAATTGGKAFVQYQQRLADQKQLGSLTQTFFEHIRDHTLAPAYETFDERFRDRVSRSQFENFIVQQLTARLGTITSIEPPVIYEFEDDPETDARLGVGIAVLRLDKVPGDQPLRVEVRYRRDGGTWRVANIPEWFPGVAATGQPGQAPGNGGMPVGPAGPPGL